MNSPYLSVVPAVVIVEELVAVVVLKNYKKCERNSEQNENQMKCT